MSHMTPTQRSNPSLQHAMLVTDNDSMKRKKVKHANQHHQSQHNSVAATRRKKHIPNTMSKSSTKPYKQSRLKNATLEPSQPMVSLSKHLVSKQ